MSKNTATPYLSKILGEKLLHGGDYFPEQWPREVWTEDMRLMKLAGVNAVSLGMFSWAALEARDGAYDFSWMDEVIDRLHIQDTHVLLATPSAAFPPWMARQYPEILRTDESGVRSLYRGRQNHCLTSPTFRRKVREINTELGRRYAQHPAVLLWHISNEYCGRCYCELCAAAFRSWLEVRYQSLDRLNQAWWSTFWSHRYTDWEQIDPPSAVRGEKAVHGLDLAWKRFCTDQTIALMKEEISTVKAFNDAIPAGTNFFHFYEGLDYFQLAKEVDIVMWDNYPFWHRESASEAEEAALTAMEHDMMRSMRGGQSFLMVESVPSAPNWQPINKLKRPGMALLSALQAVAHGSDSVMYFQWRKSRGSFEKFHGAVVDHCGHEDTRVFRDVAETGRILSQLPAIAGGRVPAEVAVLYDWNTRWAIEGYSGLRQDRDYLGEVADCYRAFWNQSISCDVIDQTCDFAPYKLLVAPWLYLLRPDAARRLEEFVSSGGSLVLTHGSSTVDEDDLVFPGGAPGPLRDLLGIWVEETDALYDGERVRLTLEKEYFRRTGPEAWAKKICERLRLNTARPLGRYASEFYAGEPCITENSFDEGKAYYIGCKVEQSVLESFLTGFTERLQLKLNWPCPLPTGVHVQRRQAGHETWHFVMNFNAQSETVAINDHAFIDVVDGAKLSGRISISAFGVKILKSRAAPACGPTN